MYFFPVETRSGSALRTLRELAGLSSGEVAKLAVVSDAYLLRVESGEVEPSREWIWHVAFVIAEEISRSKAKGSVRSLAVAS